MTRHLENSEDPGKSDHTDKDEGLEILILGNHEADIEGQDGTQVDPIND